LKKEFTAVLLVAVLFSTITYMGNAQGASQANIDGWQVAVGNVDYNQSNGILKLSGDDLYPGPTIYKEISPQTDFEFSLQVKAETLGEVSRDPAGEGFTIALLSNASMFGTAVGVNFEFRARGGGQFLVMRHNDLCDFYGWGCDWTPFLYNSLGYNNGYSYWHPNASVNANDATYMPNMWYPSAPLNNSNALVKPDVWYTMKLKVEEIPFTVTAQVLDENGSLLGSYVASDMNNFAFKDIKCLGLSSGFGGTFHIQNITEIIPTPTLSYIPYQADNATSPQTPTAKDTPLETPVVSPSVSPAANQTSTPIILQQNSTKLAGVSPVTIFSMGVVAITIVLSAITLRKLFVKGINRKR
jgi:hypothetical protein